MNNTNNSNARGGARKKKKPTNVKGNLQVQKIKNVADLPVRNTTNMMRAEEKKLRSLVQQKATLTVQNGMVNVSMSKNKVDSLLECVLNPEKADRVMPINLGDKAVCQYVGSSLDMQLDNGLVGQTSFKSFIACSGNPECPLATSKQGTLNWTTTAGNFFQIESHFEGELGKPTCFTGNLWLSNSNQLVSLMLPSEIVATSNYAYNNVIIPAASIKMYECNWASQALNISTVNKGDTGVIRFYNSAGAALNSTNFTDVPVLITPNATTAAFSIFTEKGGEIDLKLAVTADTNFSIPGLYNLKPIISSTYQSVASTIETHRVVSSSVTLTYAPDLQFGGGNLLSAVCDKEELSLTLNTWENYLYTRRRSYLNRAFTGGYNLFISTPSTLEFENANRMNHFAPDGGSLALTLVSYNPSNAAILTELNMQVKGHQWYEFSTDDMSRNPRRYMSQDVVAARILSGLAALYRPSENAKHHDINKVVAKAWHWFNGGSEEAQALRKAASDLGKGALKLLPGLLAAL